MFDLLTGKASDCTGLSRRAFLRVGGLSVLGLSLPTFLRLQHLRAAETGVPAKTARCILLWMQGGPSHIDTMDPKPDAPAEVRGEFGTIPTTLPGVRFSEHLPLLARQTDKFSVIRGHDPKNGSHGVADHLMMSGHKFNAAMRVRNVLIRPPFIMYYLTFLLPEAGDLLRRHGFSVEMRELDHGIRWTDLRLVVAVKAAPG